MRVLVNDWFKCWGIIITIYSFLLSSILFFILGVINLMIGCIDLGVITIYKNSEE